MLHNNKFKIPQFFKRFLKDIFKRPGACEAVDCKLFKPHNYFKRKITLRY